jgi:allantoinase
MLAAVRVGGFGADRHLLARPVLATQPNLTVLDYGDAVVAPGLIDIHVHMNEPGRTEWEGESLTVTASVLPPGCWQQSRFVS